MFQERQGGSGFENFCLSARTRPDPDFHHGLVIAPFRKPLGMAITLLSTLFDKLRVIPDLVVDFPNKGCGTRLWTTIETVMDFRESGTLYYSSFLKLIKLSSIHL